MRATPAGAPGQIRIAAPALFVEARFRGLAIADRLLGRDETRGFTIGAARGATAPVNPAYLGAAAGLAETPPQPLVEVENDGFVLNLIGALSAELRTPTQHVLLRPDRNLGQAPLTLGSQTRLHVACGEVVFEIWAAEPQPAVPRPWLSPDWRTVGRYAVGVALVFLVLALVIFSSPADPRALSLDELDVSRRFVGVQIIPPQVPDPPIDRARAWLNPGGGGAQAAAGPAGRAGKPDAAKVDRRRATQGTAPQTAAEAAAQVRRNPMLALLDGQRTASLVSVLSDQSALGADAQNALGHLVGSTIADAYGINGLGLRGPHPGGDGIGEATIGLGILATHGRFGDGNRAGSIKRWNFPEPQGGGLAIVSYPFQLSPAGG